MTYQLSSLREGGAYTLGKQFGDKYIKQSKLENQQPSKLEIEQSNRLNWKICENAASLILFVGGILFWKREASKVGSEAVFLGERQVEGGSWYRLSINSRGTCNG